MSGTEADDWLARPDIRDTPHFREAEAFFAAVTAAGTGQLCDLGDLSARPGGRWLAFAGARMDRLEGAPYWRVHVVPLDGGPAVCLTDGPGSDRRPRLSPEGERIALLSDREERGRYQPYLVDCSGGAARRLAGIDGTCESLEWSPDGRRLVAVYAEPGADLPAMQGSRSYAATGTAAAPWMPRLETGARTGWRRAVVLDVEAQDAPADCFHGVNVWEATWLGGDSLIAVVSDGPGEDAWYVNRLAVHDLASGRHEPAFMPEDQLGLPAGAPDGENLAVVEATCSDRLVVAGDIVVLARDGRRLGPVESFGADVSALSWLDADRLFFVGKRKFHTVAGIHSLASGRSTCLLDSDEIDGSPWFPEIVAAGPERLFAVDEAFARPPRILSVTANSRDRLAATYDGGVPAIARGIPATRHIEWRGRDGLELSGYLVCPDAPPPYPVLLDIHGGPVWMARDRWMGRQRHAAPLLRRGYAICYPNVRGSTGRGQDFARRVVGDLGGADTDDFLSCADHLVESGIADPERLGVIGVSYGGFMAAWLVTQDPRFAAAVPISPATDYLSAHWTSNIPSFDRLFLDASPFDAGSRYATRSPVLFADRVRTPTLILAGDKDWCTPAGQAIEFHRALLEAGAHSVLALYPQDGHGIRDFPAQIDNTARIIGWLERFMPPRPR